MGKSTGNVAVLERIKEDKKTKKQKTRSCEKVQKAILSVILSCKEVSGCQKFEREMSVIEGYAQIAATVMLRFYRDDRKATIHSAIVKVGREKLNIRGFPFDPSCSD